MDLTALRQTPPQEVTSKAGFRFTFRPGRPEDAPRLLQVLDVTYGGCYFSPKSEIEESLASGDTIWISVLLDDRIIGGLSYTFDLEQNMGKAASGVLLPELHQSGVGTIVTHYCDSLFYFNETSAH